MSFKFKTAKREGVHIILGLMGGTGSGKTWSALEIASGLAGGKQFAVIDTEAKRALHYADNFNFEWSDFPPPFSPDRYMEAILVAETAGYPVAVVDSFTHEHAGEGGILDMHEAELDKIAGNDWKKRERVKFLAWVKPKTKHKRMVQRLLQLRMHLVLCFRAEPKIKMVKAVKNGREVNEPVDAGWQPVCAKGLEYEMAASFMLRCERPGYFTTGTVDEMDPTGCAIKLPEPLRPFFKDGDRLSEEHGKALATWAAGTPEATATKSDGPPPFIGDKKAEKFERYIKETCPPGTSWKGLDPTFASIASLAELPEDMEPLLRKKIMAAKTDFKT